jgi:hypothetical protein
MSEKALLERIAVLEQENEQLKRANGIVKCKGITGKGTPCRNKAIPNEEYCRLHHGRPTRQEKRVPKERVNKSKKKTRIQPEHNHRIGETPHTLCPLCATHGDVLDPGNCDTTYRVIEARRLWCDEDDNDSLPELCI